MHCIVRAFGSRPLVRVVVESTGRIAYVVKPSAGNSNKTDPMAGVGFPLSDLFEYDAALADELGVAFESGDGELSALWERAKPLPL